MRVHRLLHETPSRPELAALQKADGMPASSSSKSANTARKRIPAPGTSKDSRLKRSSKCIRKARATPNCIFEGRGHSLTLDSGWKDIAEVALAWFDKKGF
jgi:hypothetical protein